MSDPTYRDEIVPDRTVKVTHLVFGLFFLGAAAIWALVQGDVITTDSLAVLGPAVLIGAGVIGLAASLANTRNRQRRHRPPAPAYDDTDTTTYDTSDTSTDTSTDETQEIR